MVTSLLWGEPANRGKYAKSIASQHNDVAWLRVDHTGDLRIRNKFNRIRAAGILRDADIVVVRHARNGIVHDVLEDRAESDGVEDIGLLLGGEVDALGVAPALDVEDACVGPDVLVVPD